MNFLIFFMSLTLSVTSFSSTKIGVVKISYNTPEWKSLTNKDGTGLFHEIVKKSLKDQSVDISYCPLRRCLQRVSSGLGDLTGSVYKGEKNFHYAKYPIWKAEISAIFNKKFSKDFKGLETIIKEKDFVASAPKVTASIDTKFHEIQTRHQAVHMLAKNRLRYYIDDKSILEGLLHNKGENLGVEKSAYHQNFNVLSQDEYEIRNVKTNYAYMVFSNTKRGKELEKLFSKGLKALYKSNELKEIYKKWGLEDKMPDLSKF